MEAESVRLVKFDPAVLGMPGPPWVGNDVRSREQGNSKEGRELWTDADICCGIPEFRLRSVFGTQLSGIWTNPPHTPPPHPTAFFSVHFCSFCPLDLSVPIYIWKIICPSSWVYVLSLLDTHRTPTFCHQPWHLNWHLNMVLSVPYYRIWSAFLFLTRAANINQLFIHLRQPYFELYATVTCKSSVLFMG